MNNCDCGRNIIESPEGQDYCSGCNNYPNCCSCVIPYKPKMVVCFSCNSEDWKIFMKLIQKSKKWICNDCHKHVLEGRIIEQSLQTETTRQNSKNVEVE